MITKHLLLRTDWANQMEYGMLRDFEDTLIEQTGAGAVSHPRRQLPPWIHKRLAQGTRYAVLRRWLPKKPLRFETEVLWVPLMGPEDFQLDLFKGWEVSAKRRVLYLLDTFPRQFRLIQSLVECCDWDLLATSFACAVEPLTKLTKRKWHCVPQGVRLERFYPRQQEKDLWPPIFISSYGRRLESYHNEIKKWCDLRKHWYDYTTVSSRTLAVPSQDAYGCLSHSMGSSLYSVCWPVELTSPKRAGGFSPVTCRWFEAAASGCVIIGQPPKDPVFKDLFGDQMVYKMPETLSAMSGWLDELQSRQQALRAEAVKNLMKRRDGWSWKTRVDQLLHLLQ